jgi:hypothetical protein
MNFIQGDNERKPCQFAVLKAKETQICLLSLPTKLGVCSFLSKKNIWRITGKTGRRRVEKMGRVQLEVHGDRGQKLTTNTFHRTRM